MSTCTSLTLVSCSSICFFKIVKRPAVDGLMNELISPDIRSDHTGCVSDICCSSRTSNIVTLVPSVPLAKRTYPLTWTDLARMDSPVRVVLVSPIAILVRLVPTAETLLVICAEYAGDKSPWCFSELMIPLSLLTPARACCATCRGVYFRLYQGALDLFLVYRFL